MATEETKPKKSFAERFAEAYKKAAKAEEADRDQAPKKFSREDFLEDTVHDDLGK